MSYFKSRKSNVRYKKMKSLIFRFDAYAITMPHNKSSSSNCSYFLVLTCYTFYGVVGWFRKYMEIRAAWDWECHSMYIANRVCGVTGLKIVAVVLKETLQEWSLSSFAWAQGSIEMYHLERDYFRCNPVEGAEGKFQGSWIKYHTSTYEQHTNANEYQHTSNIRVHTIRAQKRKRNRGLPNSFWG